MHIAIITPPGKLCKGFRITDIPLTTSKHLLNLAYIFRHVKKYDIFAYDYYFTQTPVDNCKDDLISFNPDYIFVCLDIPNLNVNLDFLKEVKETTNSKLVAVGLHIIDNQEEWLKEHNYFDYLVYNIPEVVLWKFEGSMELLGVMKIENNKIKKELPVKKSDYKVIQEIYPCYEILELEKYKSEFFNDIFVGIETQFGCAKECCFCLKSLLTKKFPIESYSYTLEYIEKLTENLSKLGVKNIIYDLCYHITNVRISLLEKIVEFSDKYKIIPGVAVRPDFLDDKMIDYIKEHFSLFIAKIPSTNPETIKKAKIGDENLLNTWRNIINDISKKVFTITEIYFGYPWESKKDINHNFANTLKCDIIEYHVIVPYYGTELYYFAKANDKLILTPKGPRCEIKDADIKEVYKIKGELYKKTYLNFGRFTNYLSKIIKDYKYVFKVYYIYNKIFKFKPDLEGERIYKIKAEPQEAQSTQDKTNLVEVQEKTQN